MRGLKFMMNSFMMNSWRRVPKFLFVITILLTLGSIILPFVFHEPLGENDYMFPKVFIFFGVVTFICLFSIATSGDFTMNKFVRSMPIAKEMYTRSVPMFLLICMGAQVVIMLAYFLFLGIIGAETTQYSDTLVLGAIVCGSALVFMPFAFSVQMGGLLGMYAVFAPIVITMFMLKKEVKLYGFNAPLSLAIGIFAAALILGALWAFWISRVRFKRSKVRVYSDAALVGNGGWQSK